MINAFIEPNQVYYHKDTKRSLNAQNICLKQIRHVTISFPLRDLRVFVVKTSLVNPREPIPLLDDVPRSIWTSIHADEAPGRPDRCEGLVSV
jgi:hypothetical protein